MCTWSGGGGVPGPGGGVYLVPGGCTWSRGGELIYTVNPCDIPGGVVRPTNGKHARKMSNPEAHLVPGGGVYLVPGGGTWSGGGVPTLTWSGGGV